MILKSSIKLARGLAKMADESNLAKFKLYSYTPIRLVNN